MWSRLRKISRGTFNDNLKRFKYLTLITTYQAVEMSLLEKNQLRWEITPRFNLRKPKRFRPLIKVGYPGPGAKPTNISIPATLKKR